MNLPAGTSGFCIGLAIPVAIGVVAHRMDPSGAFLYDHNNETGAFEPFLAKYLRATEFVVGIATGSIVLLVGSAALHPATGHLPWFFASPLMLLAWSVVLGIAFMVWLIYNYSDYRHGNAHTAVMYAATLALGFGSTGCFGVGYVWLIFMTTR